MTKRIRKNFVLQFFLDAFSNFWSVHLFLKQLSHFVIILTLMASKLLSLNVRVLMSILNFFIFGLHGRNFKSLSSDYFLFSSFSQLSKWYFWPAIWIDVLIRYICSKIFVHFFGLNYRIFCKMTLHRFYVSELSKRDKQVKLRGCEFALVKFSLV